MKRTPMLNLVLALLLAGPLLEIRSQRQEARLDLTLLLPGRAFVIAERQEDAPLRVLETPHRRSNPKAAPAFEPESGETP